MLYSYSTDVKFRVFKHTHISPKVDYKFIVFNTKITNKMKKVSKKGYSQPGFELEKTG